MIKSNLIEILKSLSGKELIQFEEFINSPFHNKNSRAIELFNILKKHHPDYNSKDLNKESLFLSLCGKEAFKESYIRNLLSDLNLLAENFLRQINFQKGHNYQIHLIEESFLRGLPELMQKKLNQFESVNNSGKYRDSEYYYRKMFIEATKSKIHHDKTLLESFRAESINSVVSYFLIYAMENSFQFLVEKQRINIEHNLDLLKLIVNHYKERIEEFKDSPLIRIFFYIGLCFLEFENESHYQKLEKSFRSHYDEINKVDRRNIYAMMQTYCQEKISARKPIYNEKLLELMIEMLERNTGTSAENEYFNLNFCRNLIMSAFLNKNTNVIEDFLSKYLSSVNPVNRESIGHHARAHLHFLRNNFSEALDECNKISFDELFVSTNDNLYFKNDVKKLTLKCYYELKYFENALTLIDTHKHFLNNSKLMKDSMKKNMNSFLKFTEELIKLNFSFDEFKYSRLLTRVGNSLLGWHTEWLLNKLNNFSLKKLN